MTDTTDDDHYDPPFTGRELENLVIGIEAAIGGYKAGMTKLGATIVRLCEAAIEEDRRKP